MCCSPSGIFGVLTDENVLTESSYTQALPTAAPNQIVLGPAQIFTAIDGNKVECFDVEIEKVMAAGSFFDALNLCGHQFSFENVDFTLCFVVGDHMSQRAVFHGFQPAAILEKKLGAL